MWTRMSSGARLAVTLAAFVGVAAGACGGEEEGATGSVADVGSDSGGDVVLDTETGVGVDAVEDVGEFQLPETFACADEPGSFGCACGEDADCNSGVCAPSSRGGSASGSILVHPEPSRPGVLAAGNGSVARRVAHGPLPHAVWAATAKCWSRSTPGWA